MTAIKQFAQGADDGELFGQVGQWLTSRAVQQELGAAVTSDVGDLWLVAADGGAAVGFALAHPLTDAVHIKHVYGNNAATRDALLRALLGMIGDKRVYTFGRGDDSLWGAHGFKFTKRKRGAFGTWERLA